MWAIRRQLSAVVLYCLPRSCCPANTSHNLMLYTVDVTGRNEQMLKTPSYASDPAWSPLLQ